MARVRDRLATTVDLPSLGMALVMMLFQRKGNLDAVAWQSLREANQPEYVDEEEPPPPEDKPIWPHLTPAGVEPQHEIEEEEYRSRV